MLDSSMHEAITKVYELFGLLVARFTLLASALDVIISAAAVSLAFLESLLTGLALELVVILTALSDLLLQSEWGRLGRKLLGKLSSRKDKQRAIS